MFRVEDDHLAVWLPGGFTATDASQFVTLAVEASARAEAEAARAARLLAQLRAAGIDPEE